MKVNIKQILDGQQIVARLLDLKLPVTTAFKLGRVVSKVDSELHIFDEQRMKLIKDLGEDIGDSQYKIKDENLETFNTSMQALLDVEIDIEIQQLSASEFGDAEITARELMVIEWLIKD